MSDDGIPFQSVSHPKTVWWKRWMIWFRRFPRRSSVEIIEIEIHER